MDTFTDIEKEVKDQFNQLLSALNQKDAGAWSKFYSDDEFVSTIAGTDYYANRNDWVNAVTNYFSTRERQHVELIKLRVTPLASDIALMTSEERSEIELKDGNDIIISKHVFTMIWKKESAGWKILHSHESWLDE